MLAVQASGRAITTVEGLAGRGDLHPVQEAFRDAHGLQCGYCTPGFLLAAVALASAGRGPRRARRSGRSSPATCAAAPATRTSSRRSSAISSAPPGTGVDRAAASGEKLPWLGASVTREEDERLLRGAARFVDDLDHVAALLRRHRALPVPARAHARARRVARRSHCAGVEAVLVGSDVLERTEPTSLLRAFPGSAKTPYRAMAWPVARYEGEAVVAVAAVDRYVAEDALDLIDIDWEPLPHVADVDDARGGARSSSTHIAEQRPRGLDAARRRRRTPRWPGPTCAWAARSAHQPDQRRAHRDAGGAGALGTTPRARSRCGPPPRRRTCVRAQLAHSLRMAESDIRVIGPDIGGGFGLKMCVYPEDIIVSLLAIDTGRAGEVGRGPRRALPRLDPRARGGARRRARRRRATARCVALRDRLRYRRRRLQLALRPAHAHQHDAARAVPAPRRARSAGASC